MIAFPSKNKENKAIKNKYRKEEELMNGYVLPLKPSENPAVIGWDYIKNNRDRLVKFDFEESSIDLTVITVCRLVVEGVSYDVTRQYFNRVDDSTTERVLVLKPVMTVNENGEEFIRSQKRRERYYNGDDSYANRKANSTAENNLMGPTANVVTKEETTSEDAEASATTENEATQS
jgi:hypothetical protein